VREVEQAVDLRVSNTLGIEADRTDDEDGIQIVIPAYYAGDDHAILLDVVASGPGKIAEVRVRYKDLVNLSNAVSRASLSLPAGRRPSNPLSRNVCKNILATWIAGDLAAVSKQLEGHNPDQAQASINKILERIALFVEGHPEFTDDPELARDKDMLTIYHDLLARRSEWLRDQKAHDHLINSLAYAGRVKLPPGH